MKTPMSGELKLPLTGVALHKSEGSKTLSVIEGEIFTLANGLETQLKPSPRLQ